MAGSGDGLGVGLGLGVLGVGCSDVGRVFCSVLGGWGHLFLCCSFSFSVSSFLF